MLDKDFSSQKQTAFEARFDAQKIAFGPIVFQCVRYAWKRGMLEALAKAGSLGLSVETLAQTGQWTAYALKVVLESCLSAGVVKLQNGHYVLDKTGYCVLTDKITQINLNFMHDVCYQGLFDLDVALDQEKPIGLRHHGDWSSLYEGMSVMPEPAKESWFLFDQYYSDISFPSIMPDVLATNPMHIMDIGANTGKFSIAALKAHPSVELHLLDLPQQLAMAKETLLKAGLENRAHLHPVDMLNTDTPFPGGMDVIWMSQFLSCFSEAMISAILQRAVNALAKNGQVLIMDTFWDRQRYDIAAYCLINTSPYFTTIASGNSKIYESDVYIRLCEAAGLQLLSVRDGIGFCHSLLRFVRKTTG
ncbi:MAG: class I SAM-dependent methyltransferase [Methylobacillus sp.]|nr:class I SAM-dependent methyltransferase [Methylobacillus sp.]